MAKKPRCPNGSRRKPRKTGKCVKNKKTKKKSKSKTKSMSKTLTLPSSKTKSKSKSKSKSNSKTKKKGNYRSFLKCEMRRLKKENPTMKQQNIMKMAAKNWKA